MKDTLLVFAGFVVIVLGLALGKAWQYYAAEAAFYAYKKEVVDLQHRFATDNNAAPIESCREFVRIVQRIANRYAKAGIKYHNLGLDMNRLARLYPNIIYQSSLTNDELVAQLKKIEEEAVSIRELTERCAAT